MQAKLWLGVLVVLLAGAGGVAAQQEPEKEKEDAGIESQAPGSRTTLLTLRLKDRLLRDVVQSIRRKAGVNIIIDETIEDTVTIDLQDVPLGVVLDFIARPRGLDVDVRDGKIIVR